MDDRSHQHELSYFFQSELYHTMGAYEVVVQRLLKLKHRLEQHRLQSKDDKADRAGWGRLFGKDDLDATLGLNERLRQLAHKPAGLRDDYSTIQRRHGKVRDRVPPRHPAAPMELHETRNNPSNFSWIIDFHQTSIQALKAVRRKGEPRLGHRRRILGTNLSNDELLLELGLRLDVVHDPHRDKPATDAFTMSRDGRLERNRVRLHKAEQRIAVKTATNRAELILNDHMRASGGPMPMALHTYVTHALIEAHMRMHQAEHLLSHNFRDKVELREHIDHEVQRELRLSIVLNTFVYVAGRSTPWIFAHDDAERVDVIEHYRSRCDTLTPTYCMWIACQVSLLALHRRAYARWLLNEKSLAYKDFFKLKRLIRELEPLLEARISKAPGAMTFLNGLYAIAEHHTGQVYRAEHAYGAALRHFDSSSKRLEPLLRERRRDLPSSNTAEEREQHELHGVLRNSRWRAHLLISQGKTHYELGKIKHSLLCYALAWRTYLEIAHTESRTDPNLATIHALITWLKRVCNDPDIRKSEIRVRFTPLIEQFQSVSGPPHLRLLAAEIMLRLGHLLFILKLPRENLQDGVPDDSLAKRCLLTAAKLDAWNLLIEADLLNVERRKTYHERHSKLGLPTPSGQTAAPVDSEDFDARDTTPNPLGLLWATGSDEFEETARVIEYVLQCWLAERDRALVAREAKEPSPFVLDEDKQIDAEIASTLLEDFLIHTHSSNVKLAQVYRYLMQKGVEKREVEKGLTPMLEVTCMRRYSSFFPFLPRPSAFRVLGGGYFVRVYDKPRHPKRKSGGQTHKSGDNTGALPPFGIVVDPGPDFLENLYRCGYSLDDIHMVIVTHDHADHIAALDAMLALLGYRGILGATRFRRDRKNPANSRYLTIVGNKSVYRRYMFFNDKRFPIIKSGKNKGKRRPDAVKVLSFEEFCDITESKTDKRKQNIPDLPPTLRVAPIRTAAHVDAHGHLSQGFLLSVGKGSKRSTMLFTSDTGPRALDPAPPTAVDVHTPDSTPSKAKDLKHAIDEADVVIAHVSSTPIPELRKLAGLKHKPGGKKSVSVKETEAFEEIWGLISAHAFGSDPKGRPPGISASEARLFELSRRFLLHQLQFGFRTRRKDGRKGPEISPLSNLSEFAKQTEKHLFLEGILRIGRRMQRRQSPSLLVVGELREELGSFRTGVASKMSEVLWKGAKSETHRALTADIGLKIRVTKQKKPHVQVLCSTCALDNDLVDAERFHDPRFVVEICIKGEDEGIFYNCSSHDPGRRDDPMWVEEVERFDLFGG